MKAMPLCRALALFVGPLLCLGVAESQIVTVKKAGDNTVLCMRTGLTSDLSDCGGKVDWYSYVFVGSISSISPAANDEKKLEIHPEEIFYGNPKASLTIFTSQALCLPKLAVGDRWLFYLREEKNKPIILDYYGNDSVPVADGKEQIETLRRLKTLRDRGIVRGEVRREESGINVHHVQGAIVIARGGPRQLQYVTRTNADGRYQFPPLPAGAYTLSVRPIGSFRPDGGSVELSPHGCWDLLLTQHPHARIAGYVRYRDGSPVKAAQVLLINVNGSDWQTEHVSERGYFEFSSLEPGRYVIGIYLVGKHDSIPAGGGPPPHASLYYPGVTSRSAAVPVTLRTDQKRDNIDLILSAK